MLASKKLTAQFKLSHQDAQQLEAGVAIPGIGEMLNAGILKPEDLIKQEVIRGALFTFVLSSDSLNCIAAVYQDIKNDTQKIELLKEWIDVIKKVGLIMQLCSGKYIKDRQALAQEVAVQIIANPPFLTLIFTSKLSSEYELFASKLYDYMNARIKIVETIASDYFKELFRQENKAIISITPSPKRSGVQLGREMKISYRNRQDEGTENTHEITYFVKTHQYGSRSGSGASAQPVDPKELFVYKVLEYIGLGPKVHFFFNRASAGGFFIATQDASFTKTMGGVKFFKTYEKIRMEKGSELTAEDIPNQEEVKWVSSIDIISRTFCLHDTTTNPGNYGRVTINNSINKWKIIDFRVFPGNYSEPNIFEGLLQGNGRFNYNGFLSSLLRERPLEKRIKTADLAIRDLETGIPKKHSTARKMSLLAAMNQAFCELVLYITGNGANLGLDINATLGDFARFPESELPSKVNELFNGTLSNTADLGDFGRYVKAVHENFTTLSAAVKAKNAEFNSHQEQAAAYYHH